VAAGAPAFITGTRNIVMEEFKRALLPPELALLKQIS